jgi:hypothetical protein
MKKIIILIFEIALLVISTTKAEIPQERIEQIKSQIRHGKWHNISPCGKDTAIEILTMPVKKLTFQQQYYNNHFVNSTTDEWVVMAYTSCDTFLYRHNLSLNQTANIIGIRDYDKNIKKMIFNNRNDNAFFCYFFNGIFSSNIFFFAKIKNNNIILQNLRTNIEYTVDSLLLFKFGSIEKYKELLQEEAEAVSIWMETPKTLKDAYQFLKNDYETYLSCYPEDTITAVLMFIDDVATSANLSITQKNALEYKIIDAIQAHNNTSKSYNSENDIIIASIFYSYPLKGIYGIYLKGLEFSYVLESILTKQQMETYLKHYKKQQSIISTIRDALFPSVRINSGAFVPEYRLRWNNYIANKDKYKDEQDFLRKEVFEKLE